MWSQKVSTISKLPPRSGFCRCIAFILQQLPCSKHTRWMSLSTKQKRMREEKTCVYVCVCLHLPTSVYHSWVYFLLWWLLCSILLLRGWIRCVNQELRSRTSVMVHWLKSYQPVWGTWVRSLIWEDPTGHGAAGPVNSKLLNQHAATTAARKPRPVLHSKRSHRGEKPTHSNWGSPVCSSSQPAQPKIK